MKKTLLSLVFALLFITGYCYDLPQYNNTPVNDFANTFKNPADLVNYISDANKKSGAEIVVVAISNLPNGVTINEYAKDLGNSWHIGSYNKNGILILISIGDRKTRVAVGSNLESIITNDIATDAAKQMSPYFKQADFDGGVKQAVEFLSYNITQYTANQTVETNPVPQTNENTQANPAVSVSRGTSEKESNWGNIFYYILFFILFGGVYFLYYLYKVNKAEKIENNKKMVNDKISSLEKFIEKLIGLSKNATLLPVIDGVSVNSLIPSLQEHVRYYNLLNIGKDRNYTEAQLSYFNRIDIKSIESIVNQHIRNNDKYESFKYKTNASYLNKIEDEAQEAKRFISLIKGEFINTAALETFEKGVISYNDMISNIVINKTNFETWQKSIDDLENCVIYFKKNVCNPLKNSLSEGHEKTNFVFKAKDTFYLLLDLKESMTENVWCSDSTKEKVLVAINEFKRKFDLITIAYTNSSYTKLNNIINEVKNSSVFNLLTIDKEEYEREEERKREEERDEPMRIRRSYTRNSTTVVNNNGGYGYGYGYGGGTTIIVDDNNNNGFFSSGNNDNDNNSFGSSGGNDTFSEPNTNFGDSGGNDSW